LGRKTIGSSEKTIRRKKNRMKGLLFRKGTGEKEGEIAEYLSNEAVF